MYIDEWNSMVVAAKEVKPKLVLCPNSLCSQKPENAWQLVALWGEGVSRCGARVDNQNNYNNRQNQKWK